MNSRKRSLKRRRPRRNEGSDLRSTDRLVTSMLKQESSDGGRFAGAVLLVWQQGETVKHSAYGHAELFDQHGERLPQPRAMEKDMIFDLASITKAVVTANLVALLFERGSLNPSDKVSDILPAFDRPGKRDITISDLLTHSSGLAAWVPFYLLIESPEEAVGFIAELPVRQARGHLREYSDVNFVLLGRLLEVITGERLDKLFEDLVARPLGLERTCYLPEPEWREQIVATSLGNEFEERMCAERSFPVEPTRRPRELPGWRDHVMVGEVNDANCHLAFGGVAGHAGLFSTARDLASVGSALLDAASGGTTALLKSDTLNFFTSPKVSPGQGLGWWTNRLDVSPRTFGHRGFTGTQLFIDPDNELITVLLTNRVHGALPYAEPATFTAPVLSSVYQELGIADSTKVDPWLP